MTGSISRNACHALLALALFVSCTWARAAEVDRIAEALELRPGAVVADVGAGDGEWSEALAERIGASGHLFATEVDSDLMDRIHTRLEAAGLINFTVVEGDQERTGLPEGCCDAALLRMVYHHFERPAPMRADLWRALKPDGLLAIVDIVPQKGWRELDKVPDRGGHGIPIDALVLEMGGSGFELVARHTDWSADEDRYCLVFRKVPDPPAPEPEPSLEAGEKG